MQSPVKNYTSGCLTIDVFQMWRNLHLQAIHKQTTLEKTLSNYLISIILSKLKTEEIKLISLGDMHKDDTLSN